MAILRKNPFRTQKLMSWRFWLSRTTVRKFAVLPTYYQRQKCSPGILVSSKVRFVWIFLGVRWIGASNKCGVVENGAYRFFRSLYLPNLRMQCHNYYTVLSTVLTALSGFSLTPKQMTLSDLEWSFCVKMCLELGI